MERPWQDRVYSETLPWDELLSVPTLALLARYRVELVLAVRPWDVERLPDAARALRDAGVPLSIWPMLADDAGRWANMHNAREFRALALGICDALDAAGVPPRDLLFDLEPFFFSTSGLRPDTPPQTRPSRFALGALRARFRGRFWGPGPEEEAASGGAGLYELGAGELGRAAGEVRARGIGVSAAVWPLVALDPEGGDGWQRTLGTPVDVLGAAHVSVMMYTSILEGWSRGAVRRRDARLLLARATARTARRWSAGAGMSLGCIGTGAFEDEPTYRDPSELAEDVAIARAAGCARLSLFDLGGVLSRAPAEPWLEAFTAGADAEVGPSSKRVHSARIFARAATWALGRRR
ncbi:MAG: hypothetical protein KIT84_33590 [Labilithrix sp.]|nr:hypothetical protein [Labilithrix sp.]MCW5815981.1 hypothetical protein [Labilithrix sp.]